MSEKCSVINYSFFKYIVQNLNKLAENRINYTSKVFSQVLNSEHETNSNNPYYTKISYDYMSSWEEYVQIFSESIDRILQKFLSMNNSYCTNMILKILTLAISMMNRMIVMLRRSIVLVHLLQSVQFLVGMYYNTIVTWLET